MDFHANMTTVAGTVRQEAAIQKEYRPNASGSGGNGGGGKMFKPRYPNSSFRSKKPFNADKKAKNGRMENPSLYQAHMWVERAFW